jgi:hypothetical protein
MNSSPIKQILCISIKDIETRPVLCFEIENFYKCDARKPHTELIFKSLDPMEIFSDLKLKYDFGVSLSLGLFVPLKPRYREYEHWAQIVYAHKDDKKFSLQIDEEPYRKNPARRFCTSYPIETLDKEKTIHNPDFCMRLSSTALDILLPEH